LNYKKNSSIILVFLLPCLLFAGCDKHNDKKDFVGKWKLNNVSYTIDTRVVLDGESLPAIDYPKTAVYEFQKNGKLIITYYIAGELQKNEHSYKCIGTLAMWGDNFGSGKDKRDPHSHRIEIDGQEYICVVDPENKTTKANIRMIGHCRDSIAKAIDDVDIVMMENEYIYSWSKTFVKLK